MSRSWSEVQSIILEKATRDESYRRRLLENPLRVAEEENGGSFGDSARIRVIEAEPDTGYILLPPSLPLAGELPDAALEAVAGGGDGSVMPAPLSTQQYFSGVTTNLVLPRGGWDGNHVETLRRSIRHRVR